MSKSRLIESVQAFDLASMQTLLDAKPTLMNATDREGLNLLHLACSVPPTRVQKSEANAVRVVEFLLDRGLEVDEPVGRDACTALFFAIARARSRTLVKLLLRRGAKVTSAPGGGLFAAGWWEDIDILRILLRAGAPVDVVVGVTPFLACWCWKKFDAARFFLRKRAPT